MARYANGRPTIGASKELVQAAAAVPVSSGDARRSRVVTFGRSKGEANPAADCMWDLVQALPEVGNAIEWRCKGVSRASLYVAERQPDGTAGNQTRDPAVVNATASLLSPERMPPFMEAACRMQTVPGEAWIFGYEDDSAIRRRDRLQWAVLDESAITDEGDDTFRVRYAHLGQERETIWKRGETANPLIRFWNPDPRSPWRAISPLHHVVPVMKALIKMTDLVPAIADQRLVGPRMLAVSDRLEPPPATPGHKFSEDELMNEIVKAVDAARRDPGKVDNLVAILLRGDLTEKVFEKLEWSAEFPELAVEITELLMRRVALGMPLPPEVVLGEGDTNHWGQWFNEESAVKFSIEPVVAQIASALDQFWLPAILKASRINPENYVIGYDIRTVMLRPDRSAIVIQLHDRGLVSDEATRRETGMNESDKATPEEVARRERSSGTGGGELPPSGDGTPGPDPGQGDRRSHQQSEPTSDNRDLRSAPDDGAIDQGRMAAQLMPVKELAVQVRPDLGAAANLAVLAALTRTGSKFRNGGGRSSHLALRDLKAYEIYQHVPPEVRAKCDLTQAWPDGVLEAFAAAAVEAGYDCDCAADALRAYVASCVMTGQAHDPADLTALRARLETCNV
jgi:hypothetical protein